MEELKPSGFVSKKPSEKKVLNSWSILIENDKGKGEQVYRDFLQFVGKSDISGVDFEMVEQVEKKWKFH